MSEAKDPTTNDEPAEPRSESVPAKEAEAPPAAGEAPPETAEAPADDDASGEQSAPKKKKKKKKSESEPPPSSDERPELDARGRERPKFLLRFPHDPELEVLIAAFEAGNYFKVRETAPRLAERTPHPAVKAAALELLRRTEPDPLIKFMLVVAVALFAAVVAYVYYSHG